MENTVPEDRARTIRMCKRLGIWPLDRKHRERHCMCPRCFGDDPVRMREAPTSVDPGELAHLRAKRRPKAFAWEEDYAA